MIYLMNMISMFSTCFQFIPHHIDPLHLDIRTTFLLLMFLQHKSPTESSAEVTVTSSLRVTRDTAHGEEDCEEDWQEVDDHVDE